MQSKAAKAMTVVTDVERVKACDRMRPTVTDIDFVRLALIVRWTLRRRTQKVALDVTVGRIAYDKEHDYLCI